MIRRTLLFACALLLTSGVARARAPVVPPTASELRAIVETLTAPAMDGRRAGTPGGERATERLAAWLGAAGVRPAGDSGTVVQSFRMAPGRRLGPGSALEIGGRVLTPGVDWTPHGGSRPGEITGPLAFVDDEWSGDVRGKIVVATSRRSRLETLILARSTARRPRSSSPIRCPHSIRPRRRWISPPAASRAPPPTPSAPPRIRRRRASSSTWRPR